MKSYPSNVTCTYVTRVPYQVSFTIFYSFLYIFPLWPFDEIWRKRKLRLIVIVTVKMRLIVVVSFAFCLLAGTWFVIYSGEKQQDCTPFTYSTLFLSLFVTNWVCIQSTTWYLLPKYMSFWICSFPICSIKKNWSFRFVHFKFIPEKKTNKSGSKLTKREQRNDSEFQQEDVKLKRKESELRSKVANQICSEFIPL